MTDMLPERLGALSKGTLQKVVLIQALLGDPALLVLDEPFSGLDDEAVGALDELLGERAHGGVPVIYSDHGAPGSAANSQRIWRVADGTVATGSPRSRPETVRALPAVIEVRGGERDLVLRVEEAQSDRALAALLAAGWRVLSMSAGGEDATIVVRRR